MKNAKIPELRFALIFAQSDSVEASMISGGSRILQRG